MKIIATVGKPDLAQVYIADMGEGHLLEFVEACQPPYDRNQKWILMVSTLFGCPVKCLICDAGGNYRGKPSAEEILAQIDYMVDKHFPGRRIPCDKFKIQFARMGEPALNPAVLDVLDELPDRYQSSSLMPSISTIAPHGRDEFFDRLIEIKNSRYGRGCFQFQYSIHTTDDTVRDSLIPIRKWTFARMAEYGARFLAPGDRKITLNFALAKGLPFDVDVLRNHFDPAAYLIKITPINPTLQAVQNGFESHLDPCNPESISSLVQELSRAGYDTIVSIGEVEENLIGSNCGQYVLQSMNSNELLHNGYRYEIERI